MMYTRSYHQLGLEVLESLLVLVHVAARFLRAKKTAIGVSITPKRSLAANNNNMDVAQTRV